MKIKISSERLARLYSQGKSLRAISKKEKISINTAKKYLILQGIKVKTKNMIYSLKTNNELLIGLYLGIWAGDGTQYLDNGYMIKICCDKRNDCLIKFYQKFLLDLFGKKSRVAKEPNNNRASVIFGSKFIYNFVYDFLDFGRNKTLTVHLKNRTGFYSEKFLRGFLLGLMLTDGYLKQKLIFNTISANLAINVCEIIKKFDVAPRVYIHKRAKYGWKDLNMVYLRKEDSYKILNVLNQTLKEMNCTDSFSMLKGYGKMGPP